MLNAVWVVLIVGAFVSGALSGRLDEVALASTESAKVAVQLVIGLVGVMAFWLGLMRVLVQAGLLEVLARVLAPALRLMFPEVPKDHPALGMILMNMSANMLGLGNAATPFGLKAMTELERLNPRPGVATDSMVTFLAINTSGLALVPIGIIGLRASLDSKAPGAIIVTTFLATAASTLMALVLTRLLGRWRSFRAEAQPSEAAEPVAMKLPLPEMSEDRPTGSAQSRGLAAGLLALCLVAGWLALIHEAESRGVAGAIDHAVTQWALPILIVGIVLIGVAKGVAVFDCVVEGAKDAFQLAIRLVPYFIALIVAIGMFRRSGAIDHLTAWLSPLTSAVGFPAEALPMALMRPFSGKGAFGVASEIMTTHGPDSYIGQVVSTLQGSTETTFYVLALYFGVVGVKRTRHAMYACLGADLVGALVSAWACAWILG